MSAAGVQTETLEAPAVVPVEDPRVNALLFRALDIAGSAVLLVLLAPLFATIAIAIRLDSRGPVFFRQRRCGIGLSRFTINKFRTMHSDASAERHRDYVSKLLRTEPESAGTSNGLYKLEDDDRITRVGRFLRRFSLDELPQLWNVLRGDMSLVGPRPAIPYEVDFYKPSWFGRFAVKPGMTGLWQVSGRNELNFAQMVHIDLRYVEERTVWLNVRILVKTAWVVFHGRGSA